MKDTRTRGATLQKLRKRVFDYYGDGCWLCHQGGADTIDHIVPVSQGGGDELENLRPAHGRKSKNCVGNFSRKRPTHQQFNQGMRVDDSGLIITDHYIERQLGTMTSRIYLWAFKSLDEALEFARR